MEICSKCILNDHYPGLTFNDLGVCSFCRQYESFTPIGEKHLIRECEKARSIARKRNSGFDVLVPLSGGKDSTFMLYLAVKKYRLSVLAMTYDNGFLSDLAIRNIKRTVEVARVKHIYVRPRSELLKTVYRTTFRYTGDICGACDIGTNTSILMTSHTYRIPLIFSGVSPLENDSFVPDSIQDVSRFKYIMKRSGNLTRKEINEFLIYPGLNHFTQSWYKRTGYFGRLIFPLFYIENPTDREMGAIIRRELDWQDSTASEYTKHFDCVAEPFTNYIRNQIYGYERRICQYSNMVRRGEITREKALQMFQGDELWKRPAGTHEMMEYLGVTEEDLKPILAYKPLQYENHISGMNRLFALMKQMKDRFIFI